MREHVIITNLYDIAVPKDNGHAYNCCAQLVLAKQLTFPNQLPEDRDVERQKYLWLAESLLDSWNKIKLSE